MREILFYDANPSVRQMLIPDLEGLGMRVVVLDALEALEKTLQRSQGAGLLILDMTRQPEQLPILQAFVPGFIATPEHCILTTMMPTSLARFLPSDIELCFFKHVVERPFKRLDFLSFVASIASSAMIRGGAVVQPLGPTGSFSSSISQITGGGKSEDRDAELLERVSGILEIQEERVLGAFSRGHLASSNPAIGELRSSVKPLINGMGSSLLSPPTFVTEESPVLDEALLDAKSGQEASHVGESLKVIPSSNKGRQPISRRSLIAQDNARPGSSGIRPKQSSDSQGRTVSDNAFNGQALGGARRAESGSRPQAVARLRESSSDIKSQVSSKSGSSSSGLRAQVRRPHKSELEEALFEKRLPGPIGRLNDTQAVRPGLECFDFGEEHVSSSEFRHVRTEIPVPLEAIKMALAEGGDKSKEIPVKSAMDAIASVANANTEIPVPQKDIEEAIKQLQAEEAAESLARASEISNESLPKLNESASPMEDYLRWANAKTKQSTASEKNNAVLSSVELAKTDAPVDNGGEEFENTAIVSVITINDIIKPSLKAGLGLKGEREQALFSGQFSLESLILAIDQSYIQEQRFTLEIGTFPNLSVMILFGGRVLWAERLSAGLVRTSSHFLHALPSGADYKAKAIENLMSQGMDMNAAITTLELNSLYSSVCEQSVRDGIDASLSVSDSTFALYPGLIERYGKLVSERPAMGIAVAEHLYEACRQGKIKLGEATFVDYAQFVARPYRTPFNRAVTLEREAVECMHLAQKPRSFSSFKTGGFAELRDLLHRLWVFGFLDSVSQ